MNQHSAPESCGMRAASEEKLWIVLRPAYYGIADFLESGVTAKGIA